MVSKISKKLILFITFTCLIYDVIVLAFFIVPFIDKNMLLKLFDKYNIYQNLHFTIPMEDVKKFVYELMDFLIGKKAILDTKVMLDGTLTDFYSTRSLIHMGDCRNLFMAHGYLAKVLLLPITFGLVWTIMADEKWYESFYDIYKKTLILFAIILCIIISFAIINFDLFFTTFHKIFFRNDLWLFDPSKDYIINYLPHEIFIDIGIKIAIVVVVILLLIFALFYLLKKTRSRQASI